MRVLKRRSRIVSFRLSDEEYKSMMETCISQGARSLSDYARAATFRQYGTHGKNGSIELEFEALCGRVEKLDRVVRHLTRLLKQTPSVNAAAPDEAGKIEEPGL